MNQHFQQTYPAQGEGTSITKEDLFYSNYGLLHSPDYRSRYGDNFRKELPRIPAVKTYADFRAFSQAGRDLAHWHLEYETVACHPGVTVVCGEEEGSYCSSSSGNATAEEATVRSPLLKFRVTPTGHTFCHCLQAVPGIIRLSAGSLAVAAGTSERMHLERRLGIRCFDKLGGEIFQIGRPLFCGGDVALAFSAETGKPADAATAAGVADFIDNVSFAMVIVASEAVVHPCRSAQTAGEMNNNGACVQPCSACGASCHPRQVFEDSGCLLII